MWTTSSDSEVIYGLIWGDLDCGKSSVSIWQICKRKSLEYDGFLMGFFNGGQQNVFQLTGYEQLQGFQSEMWYSVCLLNVRKFYKLYILPSYYFRATDKCTICNNAILLSDI